MVAVGGVCLREFNVCRVEQLHGPLSSGSTATAPPTTNTQARVRANGQIQGYQVLLGPSMAMD
jgi:hypothetical protein